MNFLTNQELHLKTLVAARTEKNATLALLDFLVEVENRLLYAEHGFSSLWMYVHKALGYREAQTSERVGAMRLMKRVPEVKRSIQENKLSLTSAAKLATFVKREGTGAQETVALLSQVEEKSSRELERILLSKQSMPLRKPDVIKTTGAEISRISFDADEEFLLMLNRLKELQANPDLSLQDLLKRALKEYLEKREVKKRSELKGQRRGVKSVENSNDIFESERHTASLTPEVKNTSLNSRYVPTSIKNKVRMRSQDRCEFVGNAVDKNGNQFTTRCESRSQLQFDHIKPFALGGKATEENIRHLCREHNIYAAIRAFGKEKMDQYRMNQYRMNQYRLRRVG